jgi:hypothetical protein
VCAIACSTCPCVSETDHIDQQQYPRVVEADGIWYLVYEYRASVLLRTSADGLTWGPPTRVANTLIWNRWFQPCESYERIGPHPFISKGFECMAGGPPGVFVEGGVIYVFAGGGQNPGHMICYFGVASQSPRGFKPCVSNPLFTGALAYGPLGQPDAAANANFDFRYNTSAELISVRGRPYMFFEGIRGPGSVLDAGDTQFGLGLARAASREIDGKWERYPGNPLLVDVPANIGIGHADVVMFGGVTYLYTSLDGNVRARLKLVWRM